MSNINNCIYIIEGENENDFVAKEIQTSSYSNSGSGISKSNFDKLVFVSDSSLASMPSIIKKIFHRKLKVVNNGINLDAINNVKKIMQVNNIVETTPEHTRQALHEQLQQYFQCSGSSCP